jgi:hypothetical protein
MALRAMASRTAAVMKDSTPEQQKKGMEAWMQWMNGHKDAIVDNGAPLGKTKRVDANGSADTKNGEHGRSGNIAPLQSSRSHPEEAERIRTAVCRIRAGPSKRRSRWDRRHHRPVNDLPRGARGVSATRTAKQAIMGGGRSTAWNVSCSARIPASVADATMRPVHRKGGGSRPRQRP